MIMEQDLCHRLMEIPDSPSLVYSEDILLKNINTLKSVFNENRSDCIPNIYFAAKACYHLEVLSLFQMNGLGIEVMSFNEWHLARQAGFKGTSIISNSIGRSTEFLECCIKDCNIIIIDSEYDLKQVQKLASEVDSEVKIGVRIFVQNSECRSVGKNPFSEGRSKLGLSMQDHLFTEIINLCIAKGSKLKLKILHVHNKTNCSKFYNYERTLEALKNVHAYIKLKYGITDISLIDIGGGMAIEQQIPNLEGQLSKLKQTFTNLFGNQLSLLMEPGRFLVNNAGFVVAVVTEVKKVQEQLYIFTNASTNVLIPIDTAQYSLVFPNIVQEGLFNCTFADSICSPNNILVRNVLLNKIPEIGDKVIFGNCGAYTSSMASFWSSDIFPIWLWSNSTGPKQILSKEKILEARKLLLGQ